MAPKRSWIKQSVGPPLLDSLVRFIPLHSWFSYRHLKLIPQKETLVDTISSPEALNSCNSQAFPQTTSKSITQEEIALSSEDFEIVLSKLGLGSSIEETQERKRRREDNDHMEAVSCLLEEKEASMDELKRAFSIFDCNGDGFIDAVELQRVMVMLGFEEGMKLEDCEKMITTYDENGDGRIEFGEFKNMLEDVN